MISLRRMGAQFVGLALAVLVPTAALCEDFTVHLDRLAELDTARPLPAYRLERLLTHSGGPADMPERTFVTFMRFEAFGSVVLADGLDVGPSIREDWTKGRTSRSGLVDVEQVKVGWIKGSPDLLIVAWMVESGTLVRRPMNYHGYTILQLREQRSHVLLRASHACAARLTNHIQEEVGSYSRFSFDPERGLLVEHLHRSYEKPSRRPHDLARLRRMGDRPDLYVAVIDETVVLEYRVARGNLVPTACRLIYHARKNDWPAAIARFYLGPMAPRSAVLDANPRLVATRKRKASGGWHLDLVDGDEVTIPIPERWLLARFGHGLQPDKLGR